MSDRKKKGQHKIMIEILKERQNQAIGSKSNDDTRTINCQPVPRLLDTTVIKISLMCDGNIFTDVAFKNTVVNSQKLVRVGLKAKRG